MQTLLEPAVLTPVPLGLVDLAVSVGDAVVDPLVLDGPLEEALTSETEKHGVETSPFIRSAMVTITNMHTTSSSISQL